MGSAAAEPLRILTFNTDFDRKGPGILAAELSRADPVIDDALRRIAQAKPDIAVLQAVDYDRDLVAVGLIQSRLKELGLDLPYRFVARPNTGIDTGFDLDRNGKLGEARDMQGYGRFAGQGGMAVLSRHTILPEDSHDLSDVLWQDQPDPGLPLLADASYFDAGALDVLRLHSVAAWDVAVRLPEGIVHVLTSHASTPVFDGPEDRNGLRNAAELRFWADYIDALDVPFVFAGDLNVAMQGGQGLKPPLETLLSYPQLHDPKPMDEGRLETVEWDSGLSLRVSYILPSRHFGVSAAKVERAPPIEGGTRHHPVWVDLVWK